MDLKRPSLTTSSPDADVKNPTDTQSAPSTEQDAFSGYSLKEFEHLLDQLEQEKRQNLKLRSSSLS